MARFDALMKVAIRRAAAALFLLAAVAAPAAAENSGALRGTDDTELVFGAQYENARVEITFITDGIVRVELFAVGIDSDFPSLLTVDDLPDEQLYEHSARKRTISRAGGLSVKYGDGGFGLKIEAPGGADLIEIPEGGVSWEPGGGYGIHFNKFEGDRFLGLGEEAPDPILNNVDTFDQDGKVRRIFNRHHAPSELGLPFYYNPRGFGLYIDNPWAAEFNFKPASEFTYTAEGGPLRFYLIAGPDAFTVLERYTSLTGRPPVPPIWVAGYMQSRYGYRNEEDYRWLMDNFRDRDIPCDVLIFDLDWFGRGVMGNLWWNGENFPDGPGFQREVHDRNFRTITIVEPYMFEKSYNFTEAKEKGLFVMKEDGSPYVFPFWGGAPAALLDFSDPATRDWFGEKIARIKESGVDAWWTDLNEPEKEFADMRYEIGPRDAGHNLQAFLMNRAIYDLYSERYPDQRLFIMSRSGFAGIQRFGSGIWSGDVMATFRHLENQVPIALSVSLSGIPMFNSDTGGFHGEPSPELFVRWMQFSAFNPIYRSHGSHSIREPWSFGGEAERICRKYLDLRYRLAPYLYALFRDMNRRGAPVMRPLFMEFPDDPDSMLVAGQFMYGPSMLVAPVVKEGASSRRVYLPPGGWTYFWNEKKIGGPRRVRVPVDLGTMPLFVREGAIIPMGPSEEYTEQKPFDPLALHYYPSETPSEFELYEDDGLTRGYERGEFAVTPVRGEYAPGGKITVAVGETAGSYPGMPGTRDWEIVVHGSEEPERVEIDGEAAGEDMFEYDGEKEILRVKRPGSAAGFEVAVVY